MDAREIYAIVLVLRNVGINTQGKSIFPMKR